MPLFKTFKGGAHPPENKLYTEHKSIENLPIPQQVIIPLQQHIGSLPELMIEKGESVKTGQTLAKATKFVSVPIHATISGTVSSIEKRPHPLGIDTLSIVIESDSNDDWAHSIQPDANFMEFSSDEMKDRIQQAGIAGMGGAAFPTHVKLSPPPEKSIDILILNGVECEPYLTADHRLMLEHPDEILIGLRILMKILKAKQAIIGIEKNKPDVIRLFQKKTKSKKTISVLPLEVKYPQGAEKQLIKAATGRVVPSGYLPMDVGCLVQNVGTTYAVYEAVSSKKPLIERIITVTGPGIREPKNLRVRIGTPFKTIIKYCGGYTNHAVKLINGGPMMGIAQVTDEVPVIKGTSGILVLNGKSAQSNEEYPCIRCARCIDTCPMKLTPTQLATLVKHDKLEQALKIGILDCIECGTCGFICPANIYLVQYIKLGKAIVNDQQKTIESD
jgi:electron transport complex protein RnfC